MHRAGFNVPYSLTAPYWFQVYMDDAETGLCTRKVVYRGTSLIIQACAYGLMVVLGRGAFSHERGTPVPEKQSADSRTWVSRSQLSSGHGTYKTAQILVFACKSKSLKQFSLFASEGFYTSWCYHSRLQDTAF